MTLQSDLAQFTGTSQYHRVNPLMRRYLATDGVAYLAQNARCFWLLDEISFALELKKEVKNEEMTFWKLVVKDEKGVLTADDGNGHILYTKRIPYTDFPLPEISIWVSKEPSRTIMLLPSEY